MMARLVFKNQNPARGRKRVPLCTHQFVKFLFKNQNPARGRKLATSFSSAFIMIFKNQNPARGRKL